MTSEQSSRHRGISQPLPTASVSSLRDQQDASAEQISAPNRNHRDRLPLRLRTILGVMMFLVILGVVLALLATVQVAREAAANWAGKLLNEPEAMKIGVLALALLVLFIVVGFAWIIWRARQRTASRHLPDEAAAPDVEAGEAAPIPEEPRLLDEKAAFEIMADGDPLEHIRFIAVIADLIRASAKSTPFAVSIEAEWGMGKTTAMRLLRDMLEGTLRRDENGKWAHRSPGSKLFRIGDTRWRCYTTWFNAWKYRGTDMQAALLYAVLTSLPMDSMDRIFGTATPAALFQMVMNVVSGIGRNGADAQTLLDRIDMKTRYRHHLETDIRAGFEKFSAIGPDREIRPLIVVFVDDLDRCTPSEIAGILEMMKLFFDVPGCVFVMGFDPQFVARSIQRDYRGIIGDGLEYLKKLLQLNYALPQPNDDALRAYIGGCVRHAGLTGFFSEVERAADAGDYQQVILEGTGRNPREIKRFINAVAVNWPVVRAKLESPDDYLTLCILLLLQVHWPRCYLELVRAAQTDMLDEVLAVIADDHKEKRAELSGQIAR